MSNRFWLVVWMSSLLFLLTACGDSLNAHSSKNDTDSGTHTNASVSISTDRSVYQPTDPIKAIVLNKLSTPIYAVDTKASCSILSLETFINGVWQVSNIARCPLGRAARLIKLDPGKAYTITIQAGVTGVSGAVFPIGTYRLVLKFSTSASLKSLTSNPTTISSMTFSVTGSGVSQ